jgi:hypothetical protein
MHLRKSVALGKQFENTMAIGHEAFVTQRLRVERRGKFVPENQYRKALVRFIERFDYLVTRRRKRHVANIEARVSWWIACKECLNWRAVGADETLARMFRVAKARFQQQQKISIHGLRCCDEEQDSSIFIRSMSRRHE